MVLPDTLAPLIALIDDNLGFLELMKEILTEQEGYRVVTAVAKENAYQMVLREQPALVILDIRMDTPDTGLEVFELLFQNPATAVIPIIICSADVRTMTEKREYLLKRGCMLLQKPFDIDDLVTAVSTALSPG